MKRSSIDLINAIQYIKCSLEDEELANYLIENCSEKRRIANLDKLSVIQSPDFKLRLSSIQMCCVGADPCHNCMLSVYYKSNTKYRCENVKISASSFEGFDIVEFKRCCVLICDMMNDLNIKEI